MNLNFHLGDDVLDDLLLGEGSAEAEAHLAGCPECAARQAVFTGAVGRFDQATLAWSEAKCTTLSRDLSGLEASGTPRLALAATALCAVALVGGLVGRNLPGRTDVAAGMTGQTSGTERAREIEGDNAMLQEIDAALYRPEPSPQQIYQMDGVVRGGGRRGAAEVRE